MATGKLAMCFHGFCSCQVIPLSAHLKAPAKGKWEGHPPNSRGLHFRFKYSYAVSEGLFLEQECQIHPAAELDPDCGGLLGGWSRTHL